MIKNYIKIAFRNFLRFKGYAAINLAGLVAGLTVGILILMFVVDELSFDQFHKNGDRIYRVVTTSSKGSGGMDANGWPIGRKLLEFPEVEKVVYLKDGSFMHVNHDGKRYEENVFFAGEDFFNIFSFDMLEGNPAVALSRPYQLVITEELRKKYFGDAPALGKTMLLRDSLEFEVAGVVANLPSESHIQFDMLLSFATYEQLDPSFNYNEGWGNINTRNYVLLKEGADAGALNKKVYGIYMDNVGEMFRQMGTELYVKLEPLKDIYLRSQVANGLGPKGSIQQIYLVSAIALFVILLACINFVNLTTARSVYRAREVGLKKIVGSTRSALFWQFIVESFILTLTALIIVMLLIDLVLPFFNDLMNKSYDLTMLFHPVILAGILLLLLLVTALSGYYPAWVLSGYKPVEVLKGRMQTSKKGVRLRRYLVIFQFCISAGLVLGTLVVLRQLDYMRDQDLGFDKEQVLVVNASRVPSTVSFEVLKNAFASQASVEKVSYTNALPGRPGWQGQWAFPEGFPEGENVSVEYMSVDEDYLKTLGLTLVAGHNFDRGNGAELKEGVMVNETAVKAMRWGSPEEAIGKEITSPSGYPEGKVIGVVQDYHGLGLQSKIWPKVMDYNPRASRYYAIRFSTGSTSDLVAKTAERWANYFPDYNFEYFFLDQDFDRQYQGEERLMNVLVIFAVLTVIIASIGLLGLVSFLVATRTKEIGVRKVLGAGVWSITGMLSREFLMLVVISNLISIPLIWYLGDQWLENFAYRMTIQPGIFILTFAATLGIAFLTVSYKTVKAALANPADTLRNE